MSRPLNRKQEQTELAARLRATGKSWVEIADVFRARYGVTARTALRQARGWSQRQAAEEWSRRWPDDIKAPKQFSSWETWPVSGHAPSLETLDRLAQLYECSVADTLADLGNYSETVDIVPPTYAGAGLARGSTTTIESSDAVGGGLAIARDRWDETIRRRHFLAGAGASAAMLLVGGLDRTPWATGADLADALKADADLIRTYWRLEGLHGPRVMFTQATDHYRQLIGWMRRTRYATERHAIAAVAADSGILLGWLHFDLEQYDEACAVYREVLDVAEEIDDPSLQAFTIGRMSRTLSECGQNANALTFADLGHRVGSEKAMPEVRSWMMATRAYVHASVGDGNAAQRDLDSAASIFTHQNNGGDVQLPTYIAFYGTRYLHKWAGHSLVRLAEHDTALPGQACRAIEEALAIWPPTSVRESGEVFAAHGTALLAQGDLAQATQATLDAHCIATRTGSPRVRRHVAELRRKLAPYRDTRAVQDLEEQLYDIPDFPVSSRLAGHIA